MLTSRKKQNVIKEMQSHQNDSGSAQVQVALLSRQIEELTKHLKSNPKDQSSRRGLLKMVSKRRKLLKYLSRTNQSVYEKLMDKIGLKKK